MPSKETWFDFVNFLSRWMSHGGQLHFHKCNHIFANGLVDTFCYSTQKEV